MVNNVRVLATCALALMVAGCSAVMAARQPGHTDLSFLSPGVPRGQVVAKLGPPITSETDQDGNLVEYYQFKQGYRTYAKVLRVMFHIGADVFTICLWEIIGMPMELVFDGNQTTVAANYDEQSRIRYSTITKK